MDLTLTAALIKAQPGWPPVVVASVYQTGLNLMRNLLRRGVRTVGVDWNPNHEGFASNYGKSYLCPNPDDDPEGWVSFMIELSRSMGTKPVIIPAADMFVSALGRHVDVLREHYIFSLESIAVQSALATKEQQYALAQKFGMPIPRTEHIQSKLDIERFASVARFPCLIKPRHEREWSALPKENKLRNLKLVMAGTADELVDAYSQTEPYQPDVVAQEIVAGGDDAKYCYLSVYGKHSRRLGYCVVHELRASEVFFGSGSIVEPILDPEIAEICDTFLRGIGYVGICEIEVKRDTRDGAIRLIEANPRYSVTADSAYYAGVDIGWLHYLDLIRMNPTPVEANHFNFRHVVLWRDVPVLRHYVAQRILSWKDIINSYRGPLRFFDFDFNDLNPTMMKIWALIQYRTRRAFGYHKRSV